MTKGCKIWLWVIFVINALSLISSFGTIGDLQDVGLGSLALLILALSAAVVVGIAILLFYQRKIGFYILAAAAVGSFIMNMTLGVNVAYAAISAIVMPGITYYFITKNEGVFT